jgi:phage shock protein C
MVRLPWRAFLVGRFRWTCPTGLAGWSRPAGLACTEMRDDGGMSNLNGSKVLVRRRDNRIIAGVCAGFADYLGLDVNLIRVLTAAIAIFTAGTAALAYLVAWAVVPEEGQKTSIAEDLLSKNRRT